jgi:hypothetical protein
MIVDAIVDEGEYTTTPESPNQDISLTGDAGVVTLWIYKLQ